MTRGWACSGTETRHLKIWTQVQLSVFGRRTKTTPPATEELLQPVDNHSSAVEQLAHRKSAQADMYDRSAKDLTSLQPQQAVWIVPERKGAPWTKGEVLEECGYRSYWVRTKEGQTLRRNRRHLRPAPTQQEHGRRRKRWPCGSLKHESGRRERTRQERREGGGGDTDRYTDPS